MGKMPRPHARRPLLRAGAIALGPLFGCLLTEAAIRSFAPFPWYPWHSATFPADQYHARYGWFGVPDLDTTYTLGEFSIGVCHNRDGFREDDFETTLAGSDGKHRVLLLGDSFAWGWGVERDDRVSEQLAQLDPSLVTLNLGQSGFATDQELLLLREFAPQLRPDVVVVLLHPNDFHGVGTSVAYGQQKPRFLLDDGRLVLTNSPVPEEAEQWRRKRELAFVETLNAAEYETLTKSHVFNWLRYATRDAPAHDEPPAVRTWAASSEVMEALLDALRAECEMLGARLLLALIPEAEQLSRDASDGDWQRPVLASCERRDIACLDLRGALSGRSGVHFRIDPHWTPKGHRLAAEALRDALSHANGNEQRQPPAGVR